MTRRRAQRSWGGETADLLPLLEDVAAVRDTVARLIADVYAGKVHPRVAAGLASLMNLQLRAIETTDLENRLIRVEKLLAQADEDSGPKRVRFPSEHVGYIVITRTPLGTSIVEVLPVR